MGNCTSCCYVEPQTAMLIDVRGNFRQVKLPITAADLMIDEPGHLISPIDDILRRTLRYQAMPADQQLSAGKLYMFVPAAKLHSKLSQSDTAMLDSLYKKRRPSKRRSSKVLPSITQETGDRIEGPLWDHLIADMARYVTMTTPEEFKFSFLRHIAKINPIQSNRVICRTRNSLYKYATQYTFILK
ncbi:hypothetical protein LguiA_011322 [Lonicera macranthoides]